MKGAMDEQLMGEINMTPLVDVMLVLLIVFMVTVPALMHSVPVELPKASTQTPKPQPQAITVSVNSQGQAFWNQTPVSDEELLVKMSEAAKASDAPMVHIRADKKVAYEHVMKVLAASHKAGLKNLGFLSDPAAP